MAQTATTGNLENAQRIILAAARYTEEHNAPAMGLIESFSLPKGAKQVTVPKVGQMDITDLQDGIDIVDEEEIGMTTVDLTAAEVGAKVILTDKLVRQAADNVMSIVGRQLGDGMARKKDTDVHALYSGLNGGTTLGAAGATMSLANVAGAIAYTKANKFGSQTYILQHPNAVFGVIADKSALAVLKSVDTRTERQRDASLRATELVMTADYGVFELDDSRGAPLTFDAAAPSTSA
jgi:hypothetical protein